MAREWLDPELDAERAEEIASATCRPTDVFEWHRLGRSAIATFNQPLVDVLKTNVKA